MMKNKPVNPSAQVIDKLEVLWVDYERTQMGVGRRLEQEHSEVIPTTKLEDIWAWEDYASRESVLWAENLIPV